MAFPVSFTVLINTSDEVTPYPGAEGLIDPDQIFDVAKAGSGDNSQAVFRQGRTYTITGTEETLLTSAGYGSHIV